ncbi:MAG: rRNA methyltransferase [Planctomycetes bacterium]|nr:rRNA methyltransferase [Planctomycetota bacterium]
MPLIELRDIHDPRLEPYASLKDRRLAESSGLFIVESKRLVERLLASAFTTVSVLCDDARCEAMAQRVPADVPLYVLPAEAMTQLAGFAIHTGVLAVACRPKMPALDEFMQQAGEPMTLLIAPRLTEQANLGAIVRVAAAMGVTGLLLGPTCCDPFYRRSVRVSMGAVFDLPILRSGDIAADLARLRGQWGMTLIAATLDGDQPLQLTTRPTSPDRLGLVLGHEVDGISTEVLALCQQRVVIPMQRGTDSLNVVTASAVFCYQLIPPIM